MKSLMDRIGETVKGRLAEAKLDPLEDKIRKYILREFAKNGSPPTTGEIIKGLGLSSLHVVNQAIEKLQKADILLTKGDKIICAYPFSTSETRHKVVFDDSHWVFALCATDALGAHFMLNEDITVISKCPECGKDIKIIVRGGHIDSRNPEDMVEFVSERERGNCAAETYCPFINFFCSRDHVEKWREKNPEYGKGELYSPNEALESSKTIFGDFLK